MARHKIKGKKSDKNSNTVGTLSKSSNSKSSGRGIKIDIRAEIWMPVFLAVYRKYCNFTASCEKAGVTRAIVYERIKSDPEFKKKFEDAREAALDRLEEKGWKRAEGNSDDLMKYFLSVHRGYAPRNSVEVTGPGGQPLGQEALLEQQKAFLLGVIDALSGKKDDQTPLQLTNGEVTVNEQSHSPENNHSKMEEKVSNNPG